MSSESSEANLATNGESLHERIDRYRESISGREFDVWFHLREKNRNLEEGYGQSRNDPTHTPDPEVHSPSRLLTCQRQAYYRSLGAPREYPLPYGVFDTGHHIEEDIIEPWLEEAVAGHDEFVNNAGHISFEEDGMVFAGSHDPRITDVRGNTLLVTEVKSTGSPEKFIEDEGVKKNHRAQLHAYMKGLLEKEDPLDDYPTGVTIYVQKESLDIFPFFVEFDEEFWEEEVLEWARENTWYRNRRQLPPAEPSLGDFECDYCEFRNRCGNFDPDEGEHQYDDTVVGYYQGDFNDMPAEGFLPVTDYPEASVVEHLLSYDVKLTPTLAGKYPELVADPPAQLADQVDNETLHAMRRKYGAVPEADVHDWHCPRCGASHDFGSLDWNGNRTERPRCPDCSMTGNILRGPKPDETN